MAWIVPIAMALMSYFGSKKAGGLQQAQQQNLDQQNQEILYQRQRRQQADPGAQCAPASLDGDAADVSAGTAGDQQTGRALGVAAAVA